MKKIVKIFLSCAVLASMTASLVSFSSFGASKEKPDPNGDGISDIVDVIYIQCYLYGEYELSDPSALDINGDHIISKVDVIAMQRYLADLDY